MTDAQTEIARNEVASMFPAADTLSYRCRALVEMVDAHAATNLVLLQLQNVVNSAISAIRLEIVTEAATAAELIKEAQDAVATTAVVKDGARTSPVGTDATSPADRTEVGGRIEEDVMRKAVILSGGGCPHCQRERLQNESRPPPLSSLSESEYGGMVGAVDLHLLDHPEGTIIILASVAQVSMDQMRAYVARADHLVRDHCDVVRRVSG